MRPQTYRVDLSDEDRVRLLLLIRQGSAPARVIRRAHTLLQASEGTVAERTLLEHPCKTSPKRYAQPHEFPPHASERML